MSRFADLFEPKPEPAPAPVVEEKEVVAEAPAAPKVTKKKKS